MWLHNIWMLPNQVRSILKDIKRTTDTVTVNHGALPWIAGGQTKHILRGGNFKHI